MDLQIFFNDWTKIMEKRLDEWNGYSCLLLTEHSVKCTVLNDYISRYWSNIDAKLGKSLLIFALGIPGEAWYRKEQERYDFLNEKEKKQFKETITAFKNLSKKEINDLRAEVHSFLELIKEDLQNEIELPAIAFFNWDKESSTEKNIDYDIFKIPEFKKGEEKKAEKYLYKLISIAKESNSEKLPYEKFVSKVQIEGYKQWFIGHAKTGLKVLKIGVTFAAAFV